jgi:hypothetical protein
MNLKEISKLWEMLMPESPSFQSAKLSSPHIILGSEAISIGGILNYVASRLPISHYDIATTSGVNFILKHRL